MPQSLQPQALTLFHTVKEVMKQIVPSNVRKNQKHGHSNSIFRKAAAMKSSHAPVAPLLPPELISRILYFYVDDALTTHSQHPRIDRLLFRFSVPFEFCSMPSTLLILPLFQVSKHFALETLRVMDLVIEELSKTLFAPLLEVYKAQRLLHRQFEGRKARHMVHVMASKQRRKIARALIAILDPLDLVRRLSKVITLACRCQGVPMLRKAIEETNMLVDGVELWQFMRENDWRSI